MQLQSLQAFLPLSQRDWVFVCSFIFMDVSVWGKCGPVKGPSGPQCPQPCVESQWPPSVTAVLEARDIQCL